MIYRDRGFRTRAAVRFYLMQCGDHQLCRRSKDAKAPKLIEVNRKKQVVWTYSDGDTVGIHHFQILATNNEAITRPVLK